MEKQVRETRKLFQNITEEEQEAIIKRAMRNSDRFRNMKSAGASEKEIFASFDEKCKMRIFTFKGERDTLMTPRDSILHHKRIMRASLVAMDPRSGHVKAYVGGPNFRYFKYDMAKQGKRQIGSTVKPFIYTFAIDQLGLTPCTYAPNLPVSIETPAGIWSPKEAGKVEYDGVLHPLYWGLANSRNNYSAWIMKQAKQPETVADFLKRHYMTVLDTIVFAAFHDWTDDESDPDDPKYMTQHTYIMATINPEIDANAWVTPELMANLFVFESNWDVFRRMAEGNRDFYFGLMIDTNHFESRLLSYGAFSISYLEGKKKISSSTLQLVADNWNGYYYNYAPADVFGSWMGTPSIKPYPNIFET